MEREKCPSLAGLRENEPLSGQLPLLLLFVLMGLAVLTKDASAHPRAETTSHDRWRLRRGYFMHSENEPSRSLRDPWPHEGTRFTRITQQAMSGRARPAPGPQTPPSCSIASQVIPLCLLSICVVKGFLGTAVESVKEEM